MLPPALAPPMFSRLPAVVVLGNATSTVFCVAAKCEAIIKTIILVNDSASSVGVSLLAGIGGREGYLIPKQISLEASGSSSSWIVMDNEMRIEEGDYIRAVPTVDGVVTILIFGDNLLIQ